MPESKAFGTAGCGGNPSVFLPAQLWLSLDEREQLFLTVASQYAVQELRVANPGHELVQLYGPSSGPSQLCAPEQLQCCGDKTQGCFVILMTVAAPGWHILLLHGWCPGSGRGWAVPACPLGWARGCSHPFPEGLGPSAGTAQAAALRADWEQIAKSQPSIYYTNLWEKRPDFKGFGVQ